MDPRPGAARHQHVLDDVLGVVTDARAEHHGGVSEPAPEYDEIEAWRDLQDALEERDREWWAGSPEADE
jgi:hypothetical protein